VVTRHGNATDMCSDAAYLQPSHQPLRRQDSGWLLHGPRFQDEPGHRYSGAGRRATDPCSWLSRGPDGWRRC